MNTRQVPRCLTIAGSDSGGGAGIQGDLKTFTVLGVYGMSAITALTAQNTVGVTRIHEVPPDFVAEQIRVVIDDIGCDAAKTGMLSNAAVINAVADVLLSCQPLPLVVDPVMVSTTGARLLAEDAVTALVERLFPLATLVTPNIPEAEIFAGMEIHDAPAAIEAAQRLRRAGARNVLVKGGDMRERGDFVYDVLVEGEEVHVLRAPRIRTDHTHGSGCALSSAICAGLAKGMTLFDAVTSGRTFVARAIAAAGPLGKGHGPVNHLAGNEETGPESA
jgi:hydroxymethylpyrimidine/phosphomethylpyrimidine kinase